MLGERVIESVCLILNEENLMFDAQFLLFISLFPLFLVISFNKKVIEWIKTEGENSLTKYSALSLECGNTIRDEEQEFEKYYFISMVSV